MLYFFILGRNPELSLAELHAVLPYGYKPIACFREVLVVECGGLDVDQLMRRLGGTVKIGEIINLSRHPEHSEEPALSLSKGSRAFIDGILQSLRSFRRTETNKKFFLGISAYALDDKARLPNVRQLREIGMEMKRELQTPSESPPYQGGEKRSVRLVTSKEITLSSVIVKKEKLLTQGVEIVLIYGGKASGSPEALPRFIGKTLAVQEFEEASQRDFGRPEREMKVGMLPIQLAKIMINLARVPICRGQSFGAAPKDCPHAILDPFCGFGTILGEAMLMGYRHLVGSDLEQKMVEATRKNLEWLNRLPPLRLRGGQEGLRALHNPPHSALSSWPKGQPSLTLREGVRLIATPVEQLSKHLPPHSVDAIVTEPYLGPTSGIKNYELRIKNELITLYINAFNEFAKVLKFGGRVVFVFPSFKTNGTLTKTSDNVLSKIKTLGFTPIQLLPQNSAFCILHSAFSILYSRPNQRVLREIFVLDFKP